MLVTSRLVGKATKLFLPLPKQNDQNWKRGTMISPGNILTEDGIMELRSAIRRDQKERRDAYVSVTTLVIGLIGATTGLLAVILK